MGSRKSMAQAKLTRGSLARQSARAGPGTPPAAVKIPLARRQL